MVSRKKSGPKKTKKSSPKRRTKKSQKLKNITFQDKLALYLNDALSIENAAIERLKLRTRQTRLQDSKVQLQHRASDRALLLGSYRTRCGSDTDPFTNRFGYLSHDDGA